MGFPITLKVTNLVSTLPHIFIYIKFHEIPDSQTEEVQNVSSNQRPWWPYRIFQPV